MICILALIVFGIFGIFSLSYRKLAIEAFDCMFRRFTLRKCQSGLDQRSRSYLTSKVRIVSPFFAKMLYKQFKLFEFLLFILMIWSVVQSGISGYNFYFHPKWKPRTN